MPSSYAVYWPNVVQMIVFTVYQTTGSTVKLAWQGCCGTFCACLNFWFICQLFPAGAKAVCSHHAFKAQMCGSNVGEGEPLNYMASVAWFDTIFVIFLFLISNSEENTKKFGMSWHIYFMMNFINPKGGVTYGHFRSHIFPGFQWDSEITTVALTSIIGATLAILATLTPFPLTNISKVDNDAKGAVQSFRMIWKDAIEYFCGSAALPKKYEIAQMISITNDRISAIQGNLRNSWWETFNIGATRRKRQLYGKLDSTMAELNDVMYAVKGGILRENFDKESSDKHAKFCKGLKEIMQVVATKTCDLLDLCRESAQDSKISDQELNLIGEGAADLQRAQETLLVKFTESSTELEASLISKDLTNEITFAYALSVFAKRVAEFAGEFGEGGDKKPRGAIKILCHFGWKGFQQTWSVKAMCAKDSIGFAVRNLISISLCFFLGYWPYFSIQTQAVLPGYSATMAITLSLLISHFSGSALQKNLHRLLGLALGKVLSILVLVALSVFEGHETIYACFHLMALWAYISIFTYMYYTSKRYSTEGCLIAGFGCYPLLQRPGGGVTDTFAALYAEIALVTIAIAIQMAVDGILVRTSPRELACNKVEELAVGISDGYTAFFDCKVEGASSVDEYVLKAKGALATAAGLVTEADPELEVAPGAKCAFKMQLATSVLDVMKLIIADLRMIGLAVQEWNPEKNIVRDVDDTGGGAKTEPKRGANQQVEMTAPGAKQQVEMTAGGDAKTEPNRGALLDAEAPDAKQQVEAKHRLTKQQIGFDSLAQMFDNFDSKQEARNDIKNSLNTMKVVLLKVLRNTDEGQIKGRQLQELEATTKFNILDGAKGIRSRANDWASQHQFPAFDRKIIVYDIRARITVALKALENTVRHIGEIDEMIVKGNACWARED